MTGVYKNPYQRYYEEYLGINNQNNIKTGINWVQGIEGAKSCNLGVGQTVLLMDSEEDRLFIKTTDDIGRPSIRSFRLVEETVENKKEDNVDMSKYVTKEEMQDMIFNILGGISNESNGEFVQSVDVTEQQTAVQKSNNKPQLKY